MRTTLLAAALYASLSNANWGDKLSYSSVENWYPSNQFFPLPTNLTEGDPAGSVSASLGPSIPFVVTANVTRFGVSKIHNEDDDGPKVLRNVADTYVVGTTFDLTYTGDNARDAGWVTGDGNSTIFTRVRTVGYRYDFPQRILDAYEPDSPGDCTKPFGAACVRALEEGRIRIGMGGLNIGASDCEDVLSGLDNNLEDNPFDKSVQNPVLLNVTNQPFLWSSSEPAAGRDPDEVHDSLSRMWLLGVTLRQKDSQTGETSHTTKALCFRVGGKAVLGGVGRLVPPIGKGVGIASSVGFIMAWAFV